MKKQFLILSSLMFCQFALADVESRPWYISGNVGLFQGNNDAIYTDQTDTIPANIRQPVQQYGYTGGLAIGYSKICHEKYVLGGEFSWNITTNSANLATSSFSDQSKIQNYFDWVFVPGLYLTDSVVAYAKAGASLAFVKDSVNSPTGFTPTYVTTNSSSSLWGLALGLGIKKMIAPRLSVYSEYQYHDYGRMNFPNFQNFTVTYSHSVRLYSQAVLLGVSYNL